MDNGRENLDVTVLIFANQSYKILHAELNNVGVMNPGPSATNMLNLNNPFLNWVSISKGMGINSKKFLIQTSYITLLKMH